MTLQEYNHLKREEDILKKLLWFVVEKDTKPFIKEKLKELKGIQKKLDDYHHHSWES